MSFTIKSVEVIDLKKSEIPISTGIGFFDHMLDQLNSHAQVGVGVVVESDVAHEADVHHNRYADLQQKELLESVGAALGDCLRENVLMPDLPKRGDSSRFCCPLDEALVECVLTVPHSSEWESSEGSLEYSLAPFGIYPRPSGRTKIGTLQTKQTEHFFEKLAKHSGLQIHLRKIRGDNGHHIVESAFKAFSRALRNLLDGTNTAFPPNQATLKQWGLESTSYNQSLALQRQGTVSRSTKETSISINLKMDGGKDGSHIHTGLFTLNEFFSIVARESHMTLNIDCKGDLWVDDHHTSEDVSIAVGQCLTQALGTKAGLNRMWCAQGHDGGAIVEVTMDLSNRPCLTQNLTLDKEEYVDSEHCEWTVEMFAHVLESLVMNSHMTVHVVEIKAGHAVRDTVMATAIAFGRALRLCAAVDPRRAGATASSKGTLSV
jgi:imidazoleglycerol-phosphate dehydratase